MKFTTQQFCDHSGGSYSEQKWKVSLNYINGIVSTFWIFSQ